MRTPGTLATVNAAMSREGRMGRKDAATRDHDERTAAVARRLALVAGLVDVAIAGLAVSDAVDKLNEAPPTQGADFRFVTFVIWSVIAATAAAIGVLNLIGAGAMWRRKPFGRVLVIIASTLGTVATILFGYNVLLIAAALLVLHIAALVAAARPGTRRALRAEPTVSEPPWPKV
ncbi:hypothetical protein [Nocardia rhizosphaerae]|uniref:Uncharacterized protein n=1 Tax=Nocardia rhizosphaerae TaxID=1691571 RepID=A0ABV8L2T3_9NOCA